MRLMSITSFALCITAAPLLASGQTPPHPGAGVEVAGDAVVAHPTPTPAWRRGAAAVLEYRLAVEADGSSWGTWLVVQGEDFGVARWIEEDQPGEVALVAGSATGGLPAEPMDVHGGLLSILFEPDAELAPGSWKASSYGDGTAIVDSVKLDMREGTAHERIEGHDTRHHILSARLWWRHVDGRGIATPVLESGTADVWLSPDLPFSWLPYAVHPSTPGLAFPLAQNWPEVGWQLVRQYGEQLERSGLLVRARVRDESRPAENPAAEVSLAGMESVRSVTVGALKNAPGGAPDATQFTELPRVGQRRAVILRTVLLAMESCAALDGAGGTFEFTTSGPQSYVGNGSGAVFTTSSGLEAATVVATGRVSRATEQAECTTIVLPSDSVRAGTYAIAGPNHHFAQPPTHVERTQTATGVHIYAEGSDIHRILVMDGGEVQVTEASAQRIAGKVIGRAWGLQLDPRFRRVLSEEFGVNLTFTAIPAPAAPDGAASPRNR